MALTNNRTMIQGDRKGKCLDRSFVITTIVTPCGDIVAMQASAETWITRKGKINTVVVLDASAYTK